MTRFLIVTFLLTTGSAFAQTDIGGTNFQDVQLERAGLIKGNYKSGQLIEQMSEGVKMMFVGETEAQNVRVEAREVSFEYPEGNTREPSRIFMEGNVNIRVEGNVVDSQTADFDLNGGIATFRGEPVIDMEEGMKLAASLIVLNLDTGDFEVHDGVRVADEDDALATATTDDTPTEATP